MASINTISNNLIKTITPASRKGDLVPLGSVWQDQTIVLTFLRRFGCKLCRAPAKQLRSVIIQRLYLYCIDVH